MAVDYVAVIPSIYPSWTELCAASCRLDNLILVDNTVQNRGVAASWNLGIKEMYARGADWTIFISAAVRFGEAGGLDMVEAIAEYPDALACEADLSGWHLIAFSRQTVDAVGLFDENFFPAYFEDNDYSRRVTLWLQERGDVQRQCVHCGTTDVSRRHFPDCPDPLSGERAHQSWPLVDVDAYDAGNAHGIKLGKVKDNPQKLLDYYERKWGGPRGLEIFEWPFGDPTNGLDYW